MPIRGVGGFPVQSSATSADFPYVNVQDQKAANTAGGTFTAGSFTTRTLNTIVNDTAGIASLASNQVTLPPGTYRCLIRAPGRAVNRHKAKLVNITTSTDLLIGCNGYSNNTNGDNNYSEIVGRFTLTNASALEVQHRCETTGTTNGLGVESNFGITEIYTVAEFWKIS